MSFDSATIALNGGQAEKSSLDSRYRFGTLRGRIVESCS